MTRLRRNARGILITSLAGVLLLGSGAPAAIAQQESIPRATENPCLWFNYPLFMPTQGSYDYWFAHDYAGLRRDINACQGPTKAKIKFKKAKVPRTGGLPSFWVYVTGHQVEVFTETMVLPPDTPPEVCSHFANMSAFSVGTEKPGWVMLRTAKPQDAGFTTFVPLKADILNHEYSAPEPCPHDVGDAGRDAGEATIEISTKGLTLETFLGGDFCQTHECASSWPSLVADKSSVFLPFSGSDLQQLRNKRKGVLSYTFSGGGSGGLNMPGECYGVPDYDGAVTCDWAANWVVTVTLIRADPMDFRRS